MRIRTQEQTKDNPAVARWYAFVNNEAHKKDYSVVLVTKKSAKGVFKELVDNNDFYDDEDIKIVIVKKDKIYLRENYELQQSLISNLVKRFNVKNTKLYHGG